MEWTNKCLICGNELGTASFNGICSKCRQNSKKNIPPSPPKPQIFGWICTRCSRSNNPSIVTCPCFIE